MDSFSRRANKPHDALAAKFVLFAGSSLGLRYFAAILLVAATAFCAGESSSAQMQDASGDAKGLAVRVRQAGLGDNKDNWLIAIGVDQYEDEKINPLTCCVNDARAIYAFFTRTGFVPESQAYLYVSGAKEKRAAPCRGNIMDTLSYVSKNASAEGTIIFQFSGHGFLDNALSGSKPATESYLMPEDGRINNLTHTAISVSNLIEIIESAHCKAARKILFIDACRNAPRKDAKGANAQISAGFLKALKSSAGQIIMNSCDTGQVSYEMTDNKHGVFTYYLLEGLRGKADPDVNGIITLTRLHEYVARQVPDWCRQTLRAEQQPWINGAQGAAIPLASTKLPVPPPVTASEPLKPPAISSGKSETEAWVALEKIETGAKDKQRGRQIAMLGSFVKEWGGTAAAGEAQKQLSALEEKEQQEAADKRRLEEERRVAQERATAEEKRREQEKRAAEARKREKFDALIQAVKEAIFKENFSGAEDGMKQAADLFPADPALEGVRRDYEKANPYIDYEEKSASLNMKMIWIKGNTQTSGGYWMGATEVTNSQYKAFLKDSGYDGASDADSDYMKHIKGSSEYASAGDAFPVVYVSWKNARAFCDWLSKKTGKAYCLPKEAQWEHVCLAGSTGDYYFGSNALQLGTYAWYSENSDRKTHPVAQKKANQWGLYDMHGNVWEWCEDAEGASRVVRGGGWVSLAVHCLASDRVGFRPEVADSDDGFRVCRVGWPR